MESSGKVERISSDVVRVQGLPDEILLKIFEDDNSWNLPFLSSISGTSTFFRDLVTPLLYRRFKYRGYEDCRGLKLKSFVSSIAKKPERLRHLQELYLSDWIYNCKLRGSLVKDTIPFQELRDRDKIPTILIWKGVNLRRLSVTYPYGRQLSFLEGPHPTLRELTVLPEGARIGLCCPKHVAVYPLDGGLNIHLVPYMLRSPKLKQLSLHAEFYAGFAPFVLQEMPQKTSTLERLSLRVGMLHDSVLVSLLEAAKRLTHFGFWPIHSSELYNSSLISSQRSGSYPRLLPRTSTFGSSLRAHSATLECINLYRGDHWWWPNLDSIGSLSSMQVLKILTIEASMLLGYNHCQHHARKDKIPSSPPRALAKLLPASLVELQLRLEAQHITRNGTDYVYDIMAGIVDDLPRLKHLEVVEISSGYHAYCQDCSDIPRSTTDDFMHLQEARRIIKLVEGTRLKFGCTNCILYDEEEKTSRSAWQLDSNLKLVPGLAGWWPDCV